MQKIFTQNRQGSLLWFGAAISIVEILTGMQLASLGLKQGFLAIVLGIGIGSLFLFGTGLIGARERTSGMESTRFAYGKKAALFFAFLNVLQLVGWTAVMLQAGAESSKAIFTAFALPESMWVILLGLGVGVWLISDIKGVSVFHALIVISLLVISVFLLIKLLAFSSTYNSEELIPALSFGMALDLAIVMPLSWTPLIADYTKKAEQKVGYTLSCAVGYFIGSTFMFSLGLLAGYYLQATDIVTLFSLFSFSSIALFILFFSTVTTAYLDVYSAGESALTLSSLFGRRTISLILLCLSIVMAIFVPTSYYQNFLYLIGAVFLPMLSILLVEYFVVKKSSFESSFNSLNMILWCIGFLCYHFQIFAALPWGSSISIIVFLAGIKIIAFALCKIMSK